VEWCWSLARAQSQLSTFQKVVPPEVYERTRTCLVQLSEFAEDASLPRLDRALGVLAGLRSEWDHLWWVAERTGQTWPVGEPSKSPFQVVRQSGWSRVSWTCPQCRWEVSWQCEAAAWEQVVWPGPLDCPMGCANTSIDDPHAGRSLVSEFVR